MFMNSIEEIFNLNQKQPLPSKGNLLIAEPFLTENYFRRSAICLIDNSSLYPTMGIVLNNRMNLYLSDVLEDMDTLQKIPLYCGGPVGNDRLYFMHTLGSIIPDSIEIVPGLYINGDFEIAKSFLLSGMETEGNIRFFIGYSGWDKGQLEEELKKHVWAVTDIKDTRELLHGGGNEYWRKLVNEMGPQYKRWLSCPQQPSMN